MQPKFDLHWIFSDFLNQDSPKVFEIAFPWTLWAVQEEDSIKGNYSYLMIGEDEHLPLMSITFL